MASEHERPKSGAEHESSKSDPIAGGPANKGAGALILDRLLKESGNNGGHNTQLTFRRGNNRSVDASGTNFGYPIHYSVVFDGTQFHATGESVGYPIKLTISSVGGVYHVRGESGGYKDNELTVTPTGSGYAVRGRWLGYTNTLTIGGSEVQGSNHGYATHVNASGGGALEGEIPDAVLLAIGVCVGTYHSK